MRWCLTGAMCLLNFLFFMNPEVCPIKHQFWDFHTWNRVDLSGVQKLFLWVNFDPLFRVSCSKSIGSDLSTPPNLPKIAVSARWKCCMLNKNNYLIQGFDFFISSRSGALSIKIKLIMIIAEFRMGLGAKMFVSVRKVRSRISPTRHL